MAATIQTYQYFSERQPLEVAVLCLLKTTLGEKLVGFISKTRAHAALSTSLSTALTKFSEFHGSWQIVHGFIELEWECLDPDQFRRVTHKSAHQRFTRVLYASGARWVEVQGDITMKFLRCMAIYTPPVLRSLSEHETHDVGGWARYVSDVQLIGYNDVDNLVMQKLFWIFEPTKVDHAKAAFKKFMWYTQGANISIKQIQAFSLGIPVSYAMLIKEIMKVADQNALILRVMPEKTELEVAKTAEELKAMLADDWDIIADVASSRGEVALDDVKHVKHVNHYG